MLGPLITKPGATATVASIRKELVQGAFVEIALPAVQRWCFLLHEHDHLATFRFPGLVVHGLAFLVVSTAIPFAVALVVVALVAIALVAIALVAIAILLPLARRKVTEDGSDSVHVCVLVSFDLLSCLQDCNIMW